MANDKKANVKYAKHFFNTFNHVPNIKCEFVQY